ncbi:hypothetical protein ACFYY8_31345 [Streptosporangium sp. NPDC001559]|uniref:hypothetical protein n=1 Tax=Streptosporangium sp. NPDC001559 TaxID=3366187 RepID=UPI0036DFE53F
MSFLQQQQGGAGLMVWVRFDDQFPIHRKVDVLSDRAFRLHVQAIFWCARNLTDGLIRSREFDAVAGRLRGAKKCVAELVELGLWIERADGWKIHDFLDYQPTKSSVLAKREVRAEAGRKGGMASGNSRKGGSGRASEREANSFDSASRSLQPSANPGPVQSPKGTRTDTGSQSSSHRYARGNDDDSIDLAIVQLLAERTGQEISVRWAAEVRRDILGGREVRPNSRRSYVTKAINERPNDFLPRDEAPKGEEPDAPPLKVVPDWCGHCERDDYRWIELADGTWAKCPSCNPTAPETFKEAAS